jgi:beta-fructofuranosidase
LIDLNMHVYICQNLQAIPRVVWLDSSERQLVQWPVEELNQLRDKEVSMNNKKLEKGDFVEVAGLITAAQVSQIL